MPFQRFVETGRVALVCDSGPNQGKLVTIVDVVDQNRVLIDGPETGVSRTALRLNQLHLTKFRVRIPYTASTKVVRKAWKDGKLDEKWSASTWAKKVEAKKKRATLTDFDRFKLRRARSTRNRVRTLVYYKLKKKASTDGTLYGKKSIPKKGKAGKDKKPAKKPEKKAEKKAAPKKK